MYGGEMAGIVSGMDGEDLPETAEEKSGGREQHDRERNFRNYEKTRQASVAAAKARAAAAFTKIFNLAGIGGLQSGSESKKKPGEKRNSEREEKRAGADVHFIEARDIGRSEAEECIFQEEDCDQRDDAGDQREQRAFGEKLSRETRAAGAESKADGYFAAASGSAGEKQIGDIDAGDQQDESYRAE